MLAAVTPLRAAAQVQLDSCGIDQSTPCSVFNAEELAALLLEKGRLAAVKPLFKPEPVKHAAAPSDGCSEKLRTGSHAANYLGSAAHL